MDKCKICRSELQLTDYNGEPAVYCEECDETFKIKKMDLEICNQCGKSVKFGSGRFVNRIPSLDTEKERNEMPYPKGAWICAECDNKYYTKIKNKK